ncbi:MAG: hypothetical protein R3338_02160 [Thermoanaerobaculia bacterium]|nr:hypothetical protein [Thermoanaerobaculia bacterium]
METVKVLAEKSEEHAWRAGREGGDIVDRGGKTRGWACVAFLICASSLMFACGDGSDEPADTATIAPATPEPNVDVDNDPAMTRTVAPGEDRSPYEGGPLEEQDAAQDVDGTRNTDSPDQPPE